MQMLRRNIEHFGEQTNLLVVDRRKTLYPSHLIVVLDLLYEIVGQLHLVLSHDDIAVLDIAAIETVKVMIEVEGRCQRILPKLVLDEEVNFLKLLLTALELEQILDAENVTTLEYRLGSIIHHHIAIGRKLVAQELDTDAEFLFQQRLQFLTAGTLVAVLFEDSPKLTDALLLFITVLTAKFFHLLDCNLILYLPTSFNIYVLVWV